MGNTTTTIYCDGVFDLFHRGHVEHFKKLKEQHYYVKLVVGVISDEDTLGYKKAKPIMDEATRAKLVGLCKYVDVCVPNAPLVVTKEFLEEHGVHYVYHSFANPEDEKKQDDFFKVPKELGIFKTIPYVEGVSTTEIKESHNWENVWNKKGTVDTKDLRLLSGYEDTEFDPEAGWGTVVKQSNIEKKDSILEVGCGAGYIAQQITKTNPDYTGLDRSQSLVNKHVDILGHAVMTGEADSLPFNDKSFDHVLCIGVFQYFPSKEYALKVLTELERVSRKTVYIGSVRHLPHDTPPKKHVTNKDQKPLKHLLMKCEDFPEAYEKLDALYDPEHYFCMVKRFEPEEPKPKNEATEQPKSEPEPKPELEEQETLP